MVVAGLATWPVVHAVLPSADASSTAPAGVGPKVGAGSSPAVAAGEEAVGTRPDDPDAWVSLGGALEAERDYARAAEAYRAAVRLRPQDTRTQVRLGLVLLQADQPGAAESVAHEILAGDPAQPEGLLVLGLA